MQKFIDPCCPKCTNSRANPCEQFIECCLTGPLCHDSAECRSAREALINKYSHSPAFREQ